MDAACPTQPRAGTAPTVSTQAVPACGRARDGGACVGVASFPSSRPLPARPRLQTEAGLVPSAVRHRPRVRRRTITAVACALLLVAAVWTGGPALTRWARRVATPQTQLTDADASPQELYRRATELLRAYYREGNIDRAIGTTAAGAAEKTAVAVPARRSPPQPRLLAEECAQPGHGMAEPGPGACRSRRQGRRSTGHCAYRARCRPCARRRLRKGGGGLPESFHAGSGKQRTAMAHGRSGHDTQGPQRCRAVLSPFSRSGAERLGRGHEAG
jgi:hypothetical protein